MNLKYYLRGLGIGIIVTAVIMGAAGSKKESLSDREIRERAAALGMTEPGSSLADMDEAGLLGASASSEALMETDSPKPEMTKEPVSEPESTPEPEPESTPEPEPESTAEPVSEPEPEDVQEPDIADAEGQESEGQVPDTADEGTGEIITIVVDTGESSFAICQKLEDAGLIELASQFDRFLYENGYDKKLRFGSYEIPAGSDWETIASILTHT